MAYVVATPSPPSQENHFLMPSPLYRSSEVTSVYSIFSWTNHAELIEGNSPTSELINDAKTVAQSLAGITIPNKPPKGVTGVKSDLLLVALLDFAGDEKAQRYTACVIIMAHQENMLFDVAHAWFDHLILPVKAAGHTRTALPSDSQTPTLQDISVLINSATRGDQKALRRLVLARENSRCAVTRLLDSDFESMPRPTERQAPVEAAHIVPFCLNKFNESSSSLADAAITWGMLKHWCSFDIQGLVGAGINDASNALLLKQELHDWFGKFGFWFEPTSVPNTYVIDCKPSQNIGIDGYNVTFRDHSNSNIPLPNPDFLKIHANFARVLYASGAGAYFDYIWKNDAHVNGDGSTDISTALAAALMTKGRRVFVT